MQHMHVQQQQQQQQQQPGGASTPHPAHQLQQQQVGCQGTQPPRKLVRPSLCSDAGSTPQQHARATAQQQQQTGTTSAAALPVPNAVGEQVAVTLQGFTEQHMQQYATHPLASSETGGALCGTKRKFVLDLSDP
jgi:hypothetical protein